MGQGELAPRGLTPGLLQPLGLTLGERCPGGEVGAHYAQTDDGARVVVKWCPSLGDIARVEDLRTRGYAAPRYLAPLPADGGFVVVQEAVDGAWRDDVDSGLVAEAVRLVDLQRDTGESSGEWTAYLRRTLVHGADGYCLHEPLRVHSPATRELVEWAEAVGRGLGPLPGSDTVHVDFHHRNILRRGQEVTAVIDWEGCRGGDAAFDLVTFCFGATHAVGDPEAFEPAWQHAREITTAEALTAYVAHMALRRVDWTIRHHPGELSRVLDVALHYTQRVAGPATSRG